VYNAPREAVEKLNHLCVTVGKERIEIPELHAGDIGVVAKLRDTHTNDTLSTKDHAIVLPKIPFPEPVITEAIEVKQRAKRRSSRPGCTSCTRKTRRFSTSTRASWGRR